MRTLVLISMVVLAGCGASVTAPTDDPLEMHVLAETQRFAKMLDKKITAEVTDYQYMTMSVDGSGKVPAAGWYDGGHIYYWRPFVREHDASVGTALAIHEVCHSIRIPHDDVFRACENLLRGR